uniref:Malonyl-CoA:ACP transacylase (MAT) domain-containing protein n=1 Tax=Timema cristinae TaxID=61476 RepID=A0A7R9CUT1_TIMCR|nr:unnamed protein product [Timema cristinae]
MDGNENMACGAAQAVESVVGMGTVQVEYDRQVSWDNLQRDFLGGANNQIFTSCMLSSVILGRPPVCGSTKFPRLSSFFPKLESRPVDVECVRLLHDLYSLNIQNYNYKGYTILGKGDAYKEIKAETFDHLTTTPVDTNNKRKCNRLPTIRPNVAEEQIALVDFLKAINIIPDGYIGHSVGELGCAYIDGCLTAEETILAAYYRGLASIETDLIPGYMAAIGLGYNDIKSMCPPEIDVACHNSLNSSTISGPENIVKQFVKELTQKNIFARAVNVANIAYHSRYIKPAAPKLLEYLQQTLNENTITQIVPEGCRAAAFLHLDSEGSSATINLSFVSRVVGHTLITEPKLRSSKWVSSSIPESEWESSSARYSSAEYHTNNLLNSVLFEESTKYIPNNAVAIEIAPHGLLQAIIKKSFGPDCIHIPLTLRGHPNAHEFLLASVGKMFAVGLLPKVSNLYPPVQYPVSRGTASLSSLVAWNHSETWLSVMDMDLSTVEGISRTVDPNITISLNQEQDRMLEGHKIFGKEGISRTVDPNITISLNQEQDRMLEGHKIFGKTYDLDRIESCNNILSDLDRIESCNNILSDLDRIESCNNILSDKDRIESLVTIFSQTRTE